MCIRDSLEDALTRSHHVLGDTRTHGRQALEDAHTRVPQALEVVPTLAPARIRALPPIRAPRARIVQTCVVSAIHIAMITAILRLPARKVHEGRRQWRRPGIVIRLRHQSVDVLHLAHRLHGLCVHRSHHMLTYVH